MCVKEYGTNQRLKCFFCSINSILNIKYTIALNGSSGIVVVERLFVFFPTNTRIELFSQKWYCNPCVLKNTVPTTSTSVFSVQLLACSTYNKPLLGMGMVEQQMQIGFLSFFLQKQESYHPPKKKKTIYVCERIRYQPATQVFLLFNYLHHQYKINHCWEWKWWNSRCGEVFCLFSFKNKNRTIHPKIRL